MEIQEKAIKKRVKLVFGIFLFLIIVVGLMSIVLGETSFGFSTTSSNPQYYSPSSYSSYSQSQIGTYWPVLNDRTTCEATTDFLVNVQPGGCQPLVVRSDLLEEQNVPVFCKLDVVKLNPLIDVSQIKSVYFSANGSNPYVAGVSYHPNMEAITSNKNMLDNPVINSVGYVVVLLKSIPVEKNMPESVKINLTASLQYDAQGIFGTGRDSFYLDVIDDKTWQLNYEQNSAFKGKIYLKADWIAGNSAGISVYQDKDTKIASFNLEKGKAVEYYMPGFYCKVKLQLVLDDITAGVKRVRLSVDDEDMWLVEGQSFLDNLCKVEKINIERVKSGENYFDKKSAVIRCSGKSQLLSFDSNVPATAGTAVPKVTIDTSYVKLKDGRYYNGGQYVYNEDGTYSRDATSDDKVFYGISSQGQETQTLTDSSIDASLQTYFEDARQEAEKLVSYYPRIASSDVFGEIWAAKALYQLGLLANKIGLEKTASDIFLRIIENYADTPYYNSAKGKITSSGMPDISYNEHYIRLLNIDSPAREDASADISITNKSGGRSRNNLQEGEINYTSDGKPLIQLKKIYTDRVDLTCSSVTKNVQEKSITLKIGESQPCNDYTIKLEMPHLKETAKVSVSSIAPSATSTASFSVAIGIEKRAIQLTPEQAQERIKNLNESIEKWGKIVNNLGTVVSGMKAACLATSTVLLVKNFFSNLEGGATARQAIMPMYYKKCEQEVGKDKVQFDNCLNKYENNISKDIELYEAKVKEVNSELTSLQESYSSNGVVDRKKVASALLATNFPGDMAYKKETINNEQGSEGNIKTEQATIPHDALAKASETDLRDLILNKDILDSPDSSDLAKYQASQNIQKIAARLELERTAAQTEPYLDSQGDLWLKSVQAQYYDSGKRKGLTYIVPIPGKYESKTDTKTDVLSGFYVLVEEDGYTDAGDIKRYWIQNIGKDSYLDAADDLKILIDMSVSTEEKGSISFLKLTTTDFTKLKNDALQAIRTANMNYGKDSFSLFGNTIKIDKNARINEVRCTDFMSPSDCNILFNVCDPVLCPSSRCDLGGAYRVANVVQSGIIGSIALCLPNWNEGIYVPVCLSGIQAGLDSYLSIMKSYRDCLQENLKTGKYVGVCDEIYSIYTCEFFWKNMVPLLDQAVIKIFEGVQGQGMKGGGEYLTVKDSWANMENSVNYLKNEYAVNAFNAFQTRTTGEIGTEICKAFISARYPTNKDFFSALLQPDSPVQFYAYYDEIPYTEATVPSTSQYKVYYHIYAGKDVGVNFQVYLKNPPESAYTKIQDNVIVDTGYIAMGGYASNTKDFTAPSGYKELCVRVNGQDNCGFKKVTTDFGLNYLSEKYYQEQVTQTVTTQKECLSGTSSVYSLAQPNVEEGVQGVISNDLQNQGVVRLCSTESPGLSTEPQRWKNIGYCDDEKVGCWIDMNSVENVIKNKNILNETVQQIGSISGQVDQLGLIYQTEADSYFAWVDAKIKEIKNKMAPNTNYNPSDDIKLITDKMIDVESRGAVNSIKAEAIYKRFEVYKEVADILGTRISQIAQQTGTSNQQTTQQTTTEKCTINSAQIGTTPLDKNNVVTIYTSNPLKEVLTISGQNCNDNTAADIYINTMGYNAKFAANNGITISLSNIVSSLNFGAEGYYLTIQPASDPTLQVSYGFKFAKPPASSASNSIV